MKITGHNVELWNLDLYVEAEVRSDESIEILTAYVTDSIDIVGVLNEAQLADVREAVERSERNE